MKVKPVIVLALLALTAVLYGCWEIASTAPPALPQAAVGAALAVEEEPADPYLTAFVNEYERYFADSMLITGTPGAAVVIVKDSQVVLLKTYGEKVVGGGDPINAHTRFRIGSLSKGFAGILTGILVSDGYLSWDDSVQGFCPNFQLKDKEQAQRVKVSHLLSHANGLPYHAFDNLLEEGHDRETIVSNYFPNAKLYGREGEFFGYQNVSFCLIEPVLEAATGKSYPQLMQEYILHPAGMYDASLDFETMENIENKAQPHRLTMSGWAAVPITPLYYDFAAAGGVNASISDMGEWLKVLLGQRPDVVDKATLESVFEPVISTGLERRTLPGFIERDSAYYAMGWRILKTGTGPLVYHAGYVNNFHSEIAFDPQEGIGICVLFNGNSPLRGKCIQAFFKRWKRVQEEKICEAIHLNHS